MANAIVMSQTSILHMAVLPISKLNEIRSPEVYIHGIPWQVEVEKNEDRNSLAVHLHCAEKRKSSNWAVAACATVKLLSFNGKKNTFVRNITPYVFSPSGWSFGFDNFIQWDELLKNDKKYVENDALQLKIEITAEDPNYEDRSTLKFENIDKSCDCGSLATIRLTVKNIENLLAVRSSQFILRGLPWELTVYKCQTSSTLGVMLESDLASEEGSCKMKMSVKLLSSKDDVNSNKESVEKHVAYCGFLHIESWDDMLKAKNGFVNNNSTTLEVKLKAGEPEGDVPIVKQTNAAKRRGLECSICLEDMDNEDTSTTIPCGHIFCTDCITKAFQKRRVCPMCQKAVKSLQRIYLPVSSC